jgi:hypothetical protein
MHKLIGEKHYGSVFKDCAEKLKALKQFFMRKFGCSSCPFDNAEVAETVINKSDLTSGHQSNFVFKKFFIQYEKHEQNEKLREGEDDERDAEVHLCIHDILAIKKAKLKKMVFKIRSVNEKS